MVPFAPAFSICRMVALASLMLATLFDTRNRSPAAKALGSSMAMLMERDGRSSPAKLMMSPLWPEPLRVMAMPFIFTCAGTPAEKVRVPD